MVYSGEILIHYLVKFFLLNHLSKQQGEREITELIFKQQRKPPMSFILLEFAFPSKMDIYIMFSQKITGHYSQNLTEVCKLHRNLTKEF